MFNDYEIKKLADDNSLIVPFNFDNLQPHSYDCTLGAAVKTPYIKEGESDWWPYTITEEWPFNLQPLKFALAGTVEYFKLPQDVVGFVQGKSTVGRNGLQIECAGLIDAGFEGNITLELFNMAPWPIELKLNQKICQVHFCYVDSPLYKNYAVTGHYNKQKGATAPVYKI